MDIDVERAAESLDYCDRTAVSIQDARLSCLPAQGAEQSTHVDAEN